MVGHRVVGLGHVGCRGYEREAKGECSRGGEQKEELGNRSGVFHERDGLCDRTCRKDCAQITHLDENRNRGRWLHQSAHCGMGRAEMKGWSFNQAISSPAMARSSLTRG